MGDLVVYKLVRVESDGTLVPVTDDDVIEVLHMVEDTGEDASYIECNPQNQDCMNDPGLISPGNSRTYSLEDSPLSGSSTASSQKWSAQRKKKVKQEDHHKSESFSFPVTGSSAAGPHQGTSCLNQLTIRQLQEAFRVAFGRPTSVKDKQWLRRRLSFGPSPPAAVRATLPRVSRAQTLAKRLRKPTRRYVEEPSDDNPLETNSLLLPGSSALVRRRWASWEVSRLIDGVSKYGTGRWTEIRQLYFPSSHRSSVDLKDKWRNLVRACFSEKGSGTKAEPLPDWVLSRVKALARREKIGSITYGSDQGGVAPGHITAGGVPGRGARRYIQLDQTQEHV